MKTPSLPSAARGLVVGLILTVLTGCRTTEPQVAIGVSSPPPPRFGSAPITAYDDYARGVASAEKIRIESIAQAGP